MRNIGSQIRTTKIIEVRCIKTIRLGYQKRDEVSSMVQDHMESRISHVDSRTNPSQGGVCNRYRISDLNGEWV